jgi:hypothetical protein
MFVVLEGETDNHVAFAAVTFLAISMCATAAEDDGVTLETVTNRFTRMFEKRIRDFEPLMRLMSKYDNVA